MALQSASNSLRPKSSGHHKPSTGLRALLIKNDLNRKRGYSDTDSGTGTTLAKKRSSPDDDDEELEEEPVGTEKQGSCSKAALQRNSYSLPSSF
jgi:hypothetical protein